jgi:hypothetical protein
MYKKHVLQALKRGIIPFCIMSSLSLIMLFSSIEFRQVKGTFLTGVIITIIAASSTIYEIEAWSLLKQSLVHFLVMLSTVFPSLLISDWYELNTPFDYLKVFCIFLLFGVIIWTIGYIIFGKILKSKI